MKLNWLKRYKEGDCINVWKEITNGQHLVKFKEHKEEIEDVIRMTIKSSKFNIEIIYEKLVKYKYPFGEEYPINYLKPNRLKSADKLIFALQRIDYNLPLIIQEFYKEIGGIDFRRKLKDEDGGEREWEYENFHENIIEKYYTDPIHIYSLDDISDEEYLKWITQDYENEWNKTPRIAICPDFYFKEGVSGGGSYEIEIENDKMVNPNIDMCELKLNNFTFIDYLRTNFNNGGFMGFEFEKELNKSATKLRNELLKDLKRI